MNKTIARYIYLLLGLLTFLCFNHSCIEEIPKALKNTVLSLQPYGIELSSNSLQFNTCESSSQTVTVKSSNVDWEFTDIPEWITITPKSGSGDTDVIVEVKENDRAENRVGLLSFRTVNSNWNYEMEFLVSQFRAPYYVSVDNDKVEIDGKGGVTQIHVNSNTNTWTFKIPSSMSWCTAHKTDDGIVLNVAANSGNKSRSGIIELYTDDVSSFLTVTQRAANIRSTTDRVDFPVDGGIRTITISVDVPWTIETSYSWIDVKTKSGDAGFVNIIMEALPNLSSTSRDGFIYIVLSDDNKIEVPVHQDGIEFNLDRNLINVPSVGSTEIISISSNINWLIPENLLPAWLTVDPLKGNGNAKLIVKIIANRGFDDRSTVFPIYVVADDDSNLILGTKEIEIIQSGRQFGADSLAIHFSDKEGSTYFNIRADGYWFVNTSDSWISISPDEGEENGTVKVSVTENKSSSDRVGFIIVRTQGQRDTIPVYQHGKYINLSSEVFIFDSKRDSAELSLSTSSHWSASSNDAWIGLSSEEGDGDCNLMITVSDNSSSINREGEVTVTCEYLNPVTIRISQKGQHLRVSTYRIDFFSEGGASEPVIVQTDGEYYTETETDWITINKESESQFTITVSKNTGPDRTGVVNVCLSEISSDQLIREITVNQKGQASSLPEGYHNGYGYIDLGLSVNWATFNVGAAKSEDYGDYYAWGEVEPYYEPGYAQSVFPIWKSGKSSGYDWTSYQYYSESKLIKYNSDTSNGFVDDKATLDPEDDVAHVKWGGEWRIPSIAELKELHRYCSWEKIKQNGINGYLVTSLVSGYTDRSIFLPAAGSRYDTSLGSGFGNDIDYWSNSRGYDAYSALSLLTCYNYDGDPGYVGEDATNRSCGFSVRPVFPSETFNNIVTNIILSKEELNMVIGENVRIYATPMNGIGSEVNADIQWLSSDESVAIVNNEGLVTAVKEGSCTITASVDSVKSTCNIVVSSPDENDSVFEYVDLGLSVNWATCNVGAASPERYGDYYAWGEIETKRYYSWDNYIWANASEKSLTKYCNAREYGNDGFYDGKTILDPENDVAHVKWGGEWRMPSVSELNELLENCTWVWSTQNGVDGYRVTSNKPGYEGNYIFLPVGYLQGDGLSGYDYIGCYLSNSVNTDNPDNAWYLDFSSGRKRLDSTYRCYGLAVRPVCPSSTYNSSASISSNE